MSLGMLSTYMKTFINQFLFNLLPKVNSNRSKFQAFSWPSSLSNEWQREKKFTIEIKKLKNIVALRFPFKISIIIRDVEHEF